MPRPLKDNTTKNHLWCVVIRPYSGAMYSDMEVCVYAKSRKEALHKALAEYNRPVPEEAIIRASRLT